MVVPRFQQDRFYKTYNKSTTLILLTEKVCSNLDIQTTYPNLIQNWSNWLNSLTSLSLSPVTTTLPTMHVCNINMTSNLQWRPAMLRFFCRVSNLVNNHDLQVEDHRGQGNVSPFSWFWMNNIHLVIVYTFENTCLLCQSLESKTMKCRGHLDVSFNISCISWDILSETNWVCFSVQPLQFTCIFSALSPCDPPAISLGANAWHKTMSRNKFPHIEFRHPYFIISNLGLTSDTKVQYSIICIYI